MHGKLCATVLVQKLFVRILQYLALTARIFVLLYDPESGTPSLPVATCLLAITNKVHWFMWVNSLCFHANILHLHSSYRAEYTGQLNAPVEAS